MSEAIGSPISDWSENIVCPINSGIFTCLGNWCPCNICIVGGENDKLSDKCLGEMVPSRLYIFWSVSNDDGDGNENGKNAIGLDWKNNKSARASRLFVHFYAVTARLRR